MRDKLIKAIPVLLISVILTLSLLGCNRTSPSQPTARNITDMYGTNLAVPAEINRVISTAPVEAQLIYMLAPERLAGLNSAWNGDPPYVLGNSASLPVIGSTSNKNLNYEAAMATDPDIVLEGKESYLAIDREKFGTIPVVGVYAGADLSTEYEAEIQFVGDLLGVPDKAQELITYYRDAMNYVNSTVSAISDSEKMIVYYAEGTDGLQTDAAGSWHTNLLAFCGGVNVANVTGTNSSQSITVTMEQIYVWDDATPIDMIIIGRGSQNTTYNHVMSSTQWQVLNCVQQQKVYVRPQNPISWFDGPPGYGQILGMYWMVHTLYPENTTDLNLNEKIKEFYSKFLHYNLSDQEVAGLLSNPS